MFVGDIPVCRIVVGGHYDTPLRLELHGSTAGAGFPRYVLSAAVGDIPEARDSPSLFPDGMMHRQKRVLCMPDNKRM